MVDRDVYIYITINKLYAVNDVYEATDITGGQTSYVPQEPGRVCLDKPQAIKPGL